MTIAAMVLYGIADLMLLIFSYRYLSARQYMPYHTEAAGRDWASVEPGLQKVMLTMLFVIGGAFLAFPLAQFGLVWQLSGPYGLLTAFSVAIPGFIMTLALVFATMRLKRQTGANTPVIPSAIGLFLNLGGLILSLPGVSW